MATVLAIPDLHAPYHLPDALRFIRWVRREYRPSEYVLLGDELDVHSISRHISNPNLSSPRDELLQGMMLLHDLYAEFPDSMKVCWEWRDSWTIDSTRYQHGIGYSGKFGALRACMDNRCNTVIGHIHSFGGVTYSNNHTNQVFAVNAGALTGDSMAFAYAKFYAHKPVLGCAVIVDGKEAYFVPYSKDKLL
jgi:hypothetical protein